MTGEILMSSPNHLPGEPLRSWLEVTRERNHNARGVLHFSESKEALRKLISGESLTMEDMVSFGRLNSFCVLLWYEPLVELMGDPFIDPDVAELFAPLVEEE